MRWNTDKYTIGIFGCDTDNCNKDLDQGDCAHVCEEKKETRVENPEVKEQVNKIYKVEMLYPFHYCIRTCLGNVFNSMN